MVQPPITQASRLAPPHDLLLPPSCAAILSGSAVLPRCLRPSPLPFLSLLTAAVLPPNSLSPLPGAPPLCTGSSSEERRVAGESSSACRRVPCRQPEVQLRSISPSCSQFVMLVLWIIYVDFNLNEVTPQVKVAPSSGNCMPAATHKTASICCHRRDERGLLLAPPPHSPVETAIFLDVAEEEHAPKKATSGSTFSQVRFTCRTMLYGT